LLWAAAALSIGPEKGIIHFGSFLQETGDERKWPSGENLSRPRCFKSGCRLTAWTSLGYGGCGCGDSLMCARPGGKQRRGLRRRRLRQLVRRALRWPSSPGPLPQRGSQLSRSQSPGQPAPFPSLPTGELVRTPATIIPSLFSLLLPFPLPCTTPPNGSTGCREAMAPRRTPAPPRSVGAAGGWEALRVERPRRRWLPSAGSSSSRFRATISADSFHSI